ncbi:IS4 family transposase [Mucilaginibacter paludis]|uniref:Transposase IS4 family protein n=1 Tax=Mucilaginibacter paludis DSM 18603 TaxID=714943 RepID=H1YC99_9SPHI|nr:IS4 family transposase [Mucilaginibacter paludis]EHQ28365.1 transposase IS4 family protein [Mucilaginibacter paludis DSM 18603]EHQ30090.1 transposase IS4 family protein [Mucilaginibacter paludis DSM 18603]
MKKVDFLALLNAMNIGADQIKKIAIDTGFLIRKGLIEPADILYAICCTATHGTVSFNDLAAKIDAETTVSVSRQAIAKKTNKESCVLFLKKILALVIISRIGKEEIDSLRRAGKFKRVLVQDSTIIKLPLRLFGFFSGVSNAQSSVCNARIQCVYDLITESFIYFTIDSYTKNDQKAAPELTIENGDLVIRDRGYLTLKEIERHWTAEADCIYRHQSNIVLLDNQTKERINLLTELKSKKQLDFEVTLNNEKGTKIRIVALPVSDEIANRRRMKAKKEAKKEPGKECLALMSWSIFMTTISRQDANYNFLFKVYSLRWRIEIIFKSWKSNMEFSKIHNVSKKQLLLILYARFIMIIIYIQYIFSPARMIIKKHQKRGLSMIKVVRYLIKNASKIIQVVKAIESYKGKIGYHLIALARYCSYDKRVRPNFEQDFDIAFLP